MNKKHYKVVGTRTASLVSEEAGPLTKEEFLLLMTLVYSAKRSGTNDTGRAELLGEPRFSGLAGPMYDGEIDGVPVVRYETWEAYEILSR